MKQIPISKIYQNIKDVMEEKRLSKLKILERRKGSSVMCVIGTTSRLLVVLLITRD